MTVEEVKTELQKIRRQNEYVAAIVHEINELRDTLKAIDYSGTKVKKSGYSDLSDVVVKIEERSKKLNNEIQELFKKKDHLRKKAAMHLNGLELQVITMRYFSNKTYTWEEIAEATHYCREYMHKVHNRALEKLAAV